MSDDDLQEIMELSHHLLESVANGDWETYEALCDPTISAFEPEARGHLVEGMPFHQHYFELGASNKPINTAITAPHVRFLGDDVAVVSYIRLLQTLNDDHHPITQHWEETRVWQRQDGQWQNVHFHRSTNS